MKLVHLRDVTLSLMREMLVIVITWGRKMRASVRALEVLKTLAAFCNTTSMSEQNVN